MMLLSHVKVAFRNLARNKVYSFINMGGLALGITACILLVIWATDELSYDRFHTNADHIYRVIANFDNSGKHIIWTNTPAPIAAFAKTEVPDIEHAVRIKYDWPSMRNPVKSEILSGIPVGYVDPSFFSVFDFKMIELNGKNPFPDNRSVIISESLAMKIFGQAAATGKSIIVGDKDEFVVRGIMQDMPHNSSIQLQALFPFSILIENFKPGDNWKSLESDWGDYNYDTFLHLAENAEPANAARQLTAIHRKNQEGSGVTYTLQPLTMLHLYGPDLSEKGIQIVRIFVIVAVIILLIACMNYINLATARATERAKEIGVRKTAGASRQKLVVQFLVESGVTVIVALLLALMTIELIMPLFNELSGKDLRFSIIDNRNWLLVGGVVCITWLIAGSYPAFLLSSFNPIRAISGKRVIGGANSFFRKILVVTQFTLSIGIIAGTLVIQKQMDFI
ncbi:MAG TPA: ABC transporter permease, partial [Chryseosolibacter sp.]|nr:ABC transporter permease [Chryseosolibacter sp.]